MFKIKINKKELIDAMNRTKLAEQTYFNGSNNFIVNNNQMGSAPSNNNNNNVSIILSL